jgi:cytidine deaminase
VKAARKKRPRTHEEREDEILLRLIERAEAARARAYAPYSKYAVGAAIECASGAVFAGCNVENSSFAATLCAERNAIAQMVAAGERGPIACAVVTGGRHPGSPCGICRQVLFEFAEDLPIALVSVGTAKSGRNGGRGVRRDTRLAELLPQGFRLRAGLRTE